MLTLAISCGQDGVAPLNGGGSCTTCKIFATASTYTGNLGGPSGADEKCMADANYPGSGTYKAMLVDGANRRACTTMNCSGGASEGQDWVIHPDAEYQRASDGVVVATANSNGVFSFNLSNPFTPSGVLIWTGLSSDWRTLVGHCNGWTDGTVSFDGGKGNTVSTSSSAIENLYESCTNTYRILCLEQ